MGKLKVSALAFGEQLNRPLGSNKVMNLLRHSVQINETETEFILSIHASQKERAKVIPGYRWDTGRRCWIYPKTAKAYDAIIDEFAEYLVGDLPVRF